MFPFSSLHLRAFYSCFYEAGNTLYRLNINSKRWRHGCNISLIPVHNLWTTYRIYELNISRRRFLLWHLSTSLVRISSKYGSKTSTWQGKVNIGNISVNRHVPWVCRDSLRPSRSDAILMQFVCRGHGFETVHWLFVSILKPLSRFVFFFRMSRIASCHALATVSCPNGHRGAIAIGTVKMESKVCYLLSTSWLLILWV